MYLSFPEIVIVDECPLSPTCIMWAWTGTDFICKIVAILLLWSLLRTKLWLIFVSLNSYTEIVERRKAWARIQPLRSLLWKCWLRISENSRRRSEQASIEHLLCTSQYVRSLCMPCSLILHHGTMSWVQFYLLCRWDIGSSERLRNLSRVTQLRNDSNETETSLTPRANSSLLHYVVLQKWWEESILGQGDSTLWQLKREEEMPHMNWCFCAERMILGWKQEASTWVAKELGSHRDQSSTAICWGFCRLCCVFRFINIPSQQLRR